MSVPNIKFEHSPANSLADSFVSSPGSQYPPLFDDTMDPSEALTPDSYDEGMFGDSIDGSMSGTPAPEKKPVKKRKSWGQQLPEPKTNLPPRKRAKTEDEKEQRRVERVLRNRRAAQSSRERKRQEVEALEAEKHAIERRNLDLEMRLAESEQQRALLQQQLEQFTGKMAVFSGSSAAPSPGQTEQFRQTPTPVTFSQELFSSRDGDDRAATTQQTVADSQSSLRTVNPASLSPEIRPQAETSNASFSDMTQHPAAMLCDLQCQSEKQRPWMSSTSAETSQAMSVMMAFSLVTATWTLLSPLNQIFNSLRTGSTLSPTTSILTTIMWLVTTTASLTNSTSKNIFTTTKATSPRPKFSLRISLLNRLLACSPNLARPLQDATMAAMRLQSEQQFTRDCLTGVGACDRRDGINSPSLEALMTLLWAIRVSEKERDRTSEPDMATEVKQSSSGLNELLRPRKMEGMRGTPPMGMNTQKTLEGWRKAYNRDRN